MIAKRASTPSDFKYGAARASRFAEPVTIAVTKSCPSALAERALTWTTDDFVIEKILAHGATSHVYSARVRGDPDLRLAIKAYEKRALTALNQHQIMREISIHSELRHRNVVQLWGAFEDAERVVLLMELADGDLNDAMNGGTMTEREAADAIRQIVSALEYLHSLNIAHRDVKPENVLVAHDGTLKLADFGLSIDLSRERAVTYVGTLMFMAPEVLKVPGKRLPEDNKDRGDLWYGPKVDTWSVGVIAYELLLGRTPFECGDDKATVFRVKHREPELPPYMSAAARRFIERALTKDAAYRPSIHMMAMAPFLQAPPSDQKTGALCAKQQ